MATQSNQLSLGAKAAPKPQTLEQKRAAHAWKCAQGCTKEYVNRAKALPALIMNSGLMQVLAFCHEKGGTHEQVAIHLRSWLREQFGNKITSDAFEGVMLVLQREDTQFYQQVNAEAFAWLRWLRQMAAASAVD